MLSPSHSLTLPLPPSVSDSTCVSVCFLFFFFSFISLMLLFQLLYTWLSLHFTHCVRFFYSRILIVTVCYNIMLSAIESKKQCFCECVFPRFGFSHFLFGFVVRVALFIQIESNVGGNVIGHQKVVSNSNK